jgi:hypothetical protein
LFCGGIPRIDQIGVVLVSFKLLFTSTVAALSLAAIVLASSSTAFAIPNEAREERCIRMSKRIHDLDKAISRTTSHLSGGDLKAAVSFRNLSALKFRGYCRGTHIYDVELFRANRIDFDLLSQQAIRESLTELGINTDKHTESLAQRNLTLLQWWDQLGTRSTGLLNRAGAAAHIAKLTAARARL